MRTQAEEKRRKYVLKRLAKAAYQSGWVNAYMVLLPGAIHMTLANLWADGLLLRNGKDWDHYRLTDAGRKELEESK